jgi:hypothetical protein
VKEVLVSSSRVGTCTRPIVGCVVVELTSDIVRACIVSSSDTKGKSKIGFACKPFSGVVWRLR